MQPQAMQLIKITRRKNDNFTVIHNGILRNKNLSLKAKGLLMTIMGLPDTWDFSVEGIVAIVQEEREAIRAGIKELIEHGYCTRYEVREKGRIVGTQYEFTDEPEAGLPYTVNPSTVKPSTEKPTQLRTKVSKKVIKKELTTYQPDFDLKEWCVARQIFTDPEEELEKWRDYHLAKGDSIKDLNASLRTWMRNSQKFLATTTSPSPPVVTLTEEQAKEMFSKQVYDRPQKLITIQ